MIKMAYVVMAFGSVFDMILKMMHGFVRVLVITVILRKR